jgi:invasion protein IalB
MQRERKGRNKNEECFLRASLAAKKRKDVVLKLEVRKKCAEPSLERATGRPLRNEETVSLIISF